MDGWENQVEAAVRIKTLLDHQSHNPGIVRYTERLLQVNASFLVAFIGYRHGGINYYIPYRTVFVFITYLYRYPGLIPNRNWKTYLYLPT